MEKYSELANIRTPHTAETMKLLGDYMSYVFRRIEFLRELHPGTMRLYRRGHVDVTREFLEFISTR